MDGVKYYPWHLLGRDAEYMCKVESLTRKLKRALFFAHTASRSRLARESEDFEDVWLPDSPSEVEGVVHTAHYCQKQLQQLREEKDLRVKVAGLRDALVMLDEVKT